jgi:hypothetical protein
MAYVAIGIVFLLVVAAGITILVMASAKDSAPEAGADTGQAGTPFSGRDRTPVGDTAQHAGRQDAAGATRTPQDAEAGGGTGAPISGPHGQGHGPAREADEPAGGRFKRDPVGGEAEAEPTVEVGEVPHPRRDA